MASHQKQFPELTELVEKLNKDRSWILEQLDKGRGLIYSCKTITTFTTTII